MRYPDFAHVLRAPICKRKSTVGNLMIRDLLEIRIDRNKDKIIQYICMNPSKATMDESDATVNKLLNFTLFLSKEKKSIIPDIGKIFILNIFPYYKENSRKLYELLESLIREDYKIFQKWQVRNLNIIKQVIDISDYIVLSWGDSPSNVSHTEISSVITRYHRWYTSQIIEYIHKTHKEKVFVLLTDGNTLLTKGLQPRHPSKRQQNLLGLRACQPKLYYSIE